MAAALRGSAEEGPAAVAGGRGTVVHVFGGHRGAAHEAQVDPASIGDLVLLVCGGVATLGRRGLDGLSIQDLCQNFHFCMESHSNTLQRKQYAQYEDTNFLLSVAVIC